VHLQTKKPKLLIIGARGFLGTYLARGAAESYEVICGNRVAPVGPGHIAIDITDRQSVGSAFEHVKPDAAVLLAALSDIDVCEKDRELALAVNLHGAEHVARAAAQARARLLYTSSAAVFDGRKHGYTEEDLPTPLSFYGETKTRAEAAVRALMPAAIILRFGLVVGFARKNGTNAMLDNLAQCWSKGTPTLLPDFEFRNPMDASTLSNFMLELLEKHEVSGIFHVGASDSISRFELGVRLAARSGYSTDLVRAQKEPNSGRAPRGLDHFLLTDKIRAICKNKIPTCNEVIERCFQ
jgi:dTDP-4-dehydrorhamnose reductase